MKKLGNGRWQITSEEYFEKIDHLFDPYTDFSDEDGKALGAFLGASLFIAGCKVGDVQWHQELGTLADFGEPSELLKFDSIDNAYERIVDDSEGFVYYDDMPSEDTHVA